MENIKNEEIISLRGKLIRQIVNDFYIKNIYMSFNEVEKLLQTALDSHLNFKTKISDLKQDTILSYGNITFEDENNIITTINFNVMTNNIVNNEDEEFKK